MIVTDERLCQECGRREREIYEEWYLSRPRMSWFLYSVDGRDSAVCYACLVIIAKAFS